MAKKSRFQSLTQEDLKGLSKDSLLSLALEGLAQAKQRQYRLKKSNYELGDYINTFNRKISKKRLRRDSPEELKSDIAYIHRYLLSYNTSVSGRITKGRTILTEISNKILAGNPKVTRISGGFRVGDDIYSDDELKRFFTMVRQVQSSSYKWKTAKATDYEVLGTVFSNWFGKDIKDINELVDKVEEKIKQREIPDVFNTVNNDDEDDDYVY